MRATNEQSQWAAHLIAENKLIVIPTDTVYGVASNAFSAEAVAKLLAAKGRDQTMPPPVLAADAEALLALGDFEGNEARRAEVERIAQHFWPGALTLVIPTKRTFGWDTEAVGKTVAVRWPDDPVAERILLATGPIAVTSANRTGFPAATSAMQAYEYFGSKISLYVEGGPRNGGQPSTILNCAGKNLEMVRRGTIGWEQIVGVL